MNTIGHRGCRDHFPENTLAAVRGSAPHVEMVEIDVQRCASGEIVVFHDEELDRLTDATGPVRETPLSELSGLQIGGSGETIPTLEAVVDTLPAGTGLNVELKHAGMAGDVLALLTDLDAELILSSFERAALAEVAAGAIRTAYLFGDSFGTALETAGDLSCEYVHPHHELVTQQRVESAHDRGLSVNAWTVPTAAAVSRLRGLGVDGVIVDSWTTVPEQ